MDQYQKFIGCGWVVGMDRETRKGWICVHDNGAPMTLPAAWHTNLLPERGASVVFTGQLSLHRNDNPTLHVEEWNEMQEKMPEQRVNLDLPKGFGRLFQHYYCVIREKQEKEMQGTKETTFERRYRMNNK